MASSGSSIFSPVVAEVDGVGIVEHVSQFYLPDESYCGLEHSSKHRCPGHDRVPARYQMSVTGWFGLILLLHCMLPLLLKTCTQS
ncbi:hypothetical protein D1007_58063 [Hordeum vulgare]|nr:hypothetical protein D1007_58063 [Hordeum vulgare]